MVLRVSDLYLSSVEEGKEREILRGVDVNIEPAETIGLVGESGAGKSMLTLAIMGLLPPTVKVKKGRIEFLGREILDKPEEQADIRGRRIGIVFQDPTASLDPLYRVGCQVAEAMKGKGRKGWRERVRDLFSRVEFKEPETILYRYPHQLSGGEKQRIMIAIALSQEPALLLADEPTASLDIRTGQGIISLLGRIQEEMRLAILFISHNLPLVSQVARRIAIMYAGQILETGFTRDVMEHPLHPYTRLLYAALPDPKKKGSPLAAVPGYPEKGRVYPCMHQAGVGADICVFYHRCPERDIRCQEGIPSLTELTPGHWTACLR
ncbi:MAG: ABC transporter ATP-binding protein [Candidatus Omnitrophota bacterium]